LLEGSLNGLTAKVQVFQEGLDQQTNMHTQQLDTVREEVQEHVSKLQTAEDTANCLLQLRHTMGEECRSLVKEAHGSLQEQIHGTNARVEEMSKALASTKESMTASTQAAIESAEKAQQARLDEVEARSATQVRMLDDRVHKLGSTLVEARADLHGAIKQDAANVRGEVC
jgi:chromosome segregation ATPase